MPDTPTFWNFTQLVNTLDGSANTDNDQFDPKIIQLTNGNTLIAYSSNHDGGVGSNPGNDIIGQLYDSLGNQIGSEIKLNRYSAHDEQDIELAALPGGGFVMIYEDRDTATSIRLQEYSSNGTEVASQTNTEATVISDGNAAFPTRENPNVAVSSSSSVLATYEVDNGGGDVDVVGEIYNSNTDTYSAPFTIFNGAAGAGQGLNGHSTTALENGSYVIVTANENPGNDEILFRIYNSNGTFDSQVSVDSSFVEASDPHVVGLTGGGFVVTWTVDNGSNAGIRARVYDEDGLNPSAILNPPTNTNLNQESPVVAALQDGGFVVVWLDRGASDIEGQRYDAAGNEVGDEFNIDTNVEQGFAVNIDIDVEGLDDGRFAITWTESPASGGLGALDTDVYTRIFDPRDDENSPNDYSTDQVIGTTGADVIDVAPADDSIYGWNGNDVFVFQPGDTGGFDFGDVFDGGSGTDTIRISGDGLVDLRTSSLSSFEELEFEANVASQDKTVRIDANQIGSGLSSFALIDGNDTAGSDDTLIIRMGSETSLSLGNWTFEDWQQSADNTDILQIFGDGSDELIAGSGLADQLFGGGGADTIFGRSGDDLVDGGSGADTLDGGAGIDSLDYSTVNTLLDVNLMTGVTSIAGETAINFENVETGNGANVIRGTDDANDIRTNGGDDVLRGFAGNDRLVGGAGNDTLQGGDGDDTMFGGNHDDYMVGGTGNDEMHGGLGNDTLQGRAGNDTLYGDEGDDILRGDSQIDMLYGGDDDDFIDAAGGADIAEGGSGADTILGGGGSDMITGGAGDDITDGGVGNNTFVFDTDDGSDRIRDWSLGNNQIDFSGNIHFDNFEEVQAAMADQGNGHLRIDFNATNEILLLNTLSTDLNASDFIF